MGGVDDDDDDGDEDAVVEEVVAVVVVVEKYIIQIPCFYFPVLFIDRRGRLIA